MPPFIAIAETDAPATRLCAIRSSLNSRSCCRRDRVDPDPVDVILAQPEQGVGDQEVAHLVAAVVEHERSPIGMRAPPRVRVLVQGGAVEPRQRPFVAGEMGRDPVQDHADPVRVQAVDELAQIVG